jgi:hypothetical protein
VDDALLVRGLERLGDLPRDRDRFVRGDGAPLQALGDVLAFGQLHREEADRARAAVQGRLLERVEAGDVRVGERRQQLGLALEAGERLPSDAKAAGSSLRATSRPSRVSVARQTSPMPPAPSGATTAYAPRRWPVVRPTRRLLER